MANPHYNYYPPAGAVLDQNEPKAYWNGTAWMLNNRIYGIPTGHRLVGRAGGPLDGWYYDWSRRAWMEPDKAQPTPPRPAGGGLVLGGGARPGLRPTAPQPQPQPTTPAAQPEKENCKMEKKDHNVLEYLVKHPIAPLVGGLMMVGSMLADEPVPPEIPDDLPEPVAKKWMMIYSQNLQRFQRRMALFENLGKVLLGYADTQAVLAALPPKKA